MFWEDMENIYVIQSDDRLYIIKNKEGILFYFDIIINLLFIRISLCMNLY